MALDTLGVLLECYSRYPGRFEEPRETAEERRTHLLGLILSCLANYREQVRQEAMLVIGQHVFGSEIMAERDKNELFSLCSKKLLFLLNEYPDGELSLYYRAAALSHISRFISRYQLVGGAVSLRGRDRVAFFPGTFDPFTWRWTSFPGRKRPSLIWCAARSSTCRWRMNFISIYSPTIRRSTLRTRRI